MIQNSLFTTAHLSDIPYILPYGQNIADHLGGISTNEAGLLIWDALCSGKNREEILALLTEAYEADDRDAALLKDDLDAFLKSLKDKQLTDSRLCVPFAPHQEHFIKIGPLTVSLRIPEKLYRDYFADFSRDDCENLKEPAQTIVCYHHAPLRHENGQVLVRNEEMLILDTKETYILLPRNSKYVYEIHTSKDGRTARLYFKYDAAKADCLGEVFQAIRFAFLVAAGQNGLCVIHSASLLHRGKAWLFSGHSGAGKSTHTNLWHQQFGTPLLNGDLNMIGLEDGAPICYGLPWCGTSGIFTNHNYPLGGIVFLKQAPENSVQKLSPDREILYLCQRLITPGWTEEQLTRNLALSASLAEKIGIYRLCCTKEPAAAIMMREAIEQE
ncbi:MAG: PqqD family protein [Roseburia sp.]|nr:PqqD family protein [Roseburia sp.]